MNIYFKFAFFRLHSMNASSEGCNLFKRTLLTQLMMNMGSFYILHLCTRLSMTQEESRDLSSLRQDSTKTPQPPDPPSLPFLYRLICCHCWPLKIYHPCTESHCAACAKLHPLCWLSASSTIITPLSIAITATSFVETARLDNSMEESMEYPKCDWQSDNRASQALTAFHVS